VRARGSAYDPRLLRYAPATRVFLVIAIALGVAAAIALIAQAWLLAKVIGGVLDAGQGLSQLGGAMAVLLGVVLARAAIAWSLQVASSRGAARAKSELRASLLGRSSRRAAAGLEVASGDLAVLATRGIDALDAYFALYLPQLCLAAIVPAVVLVAIVSQEWISAAIIAGTLPLIPLFMALVGASTQQRMAERFVLLQRLAGHFLDVVAGLPTLKVFGRAKAQTEMVATITDRYRRAALGTMRVSFLSSMILELVATVSVALVAVTVGLRLMGGNVELRTALLVLVLAPEAYLPLRQLGASYHASTEGMAAARQVFELLERPLPERAARAPAPDPANAQVCVRSLTVTREGRGVPVLDGVSLTVSPGEVLAVTGPSGSGKSTLLGVLLGLVHAQHGSVSIGGVQLAELDPASWHARLAWVPQRPHLFAASIADNIRLGRPSAPGWALRDAVRAAGLTDVVARLPDGLDTRLGVRGAGLSAGERQRVALARAFLRDAPLLLLDEPTAGLDGRTEESVLAAVGELLRGRTAVIAAHRPALVEMADRVFALEPVAAGV
jgi:ATP-binding cassette, subfamily C, bacterial CydCD